MGERRRAWWKIYCKSVITRSIFALLLLLCSGCHLEFSNFAEQPAGYKMQALAFYLLGLLCCVCVLCCCPAFSAAYSNGASLRVYCTGRTPKLEQSSFIFVKTMKPSKQSMYTQHKHTRTTRMGPSPGGSEQKNWLLFVLIWKTESNWILSLLVRNCCCCLWFHCCWWTFFLQSHVDAV